MEKHKKLHVSDCRDIYGGNFFEVGTEMNWFIGMILRKLLNSSSSVAGETEYFQTIY